MMGESVRAKRGGRLRVMESGCRGGGRSADWLVDAVAALMCLLACVCVSVIRPPPSFLSRSRNSSSSRLLLLHV